jgi:hypothetical protein
LIEAGMKLVTRYSRLRELASGALQSIAWVFRYNAGEKLGDLFWRQ